MLKHLISQTLLYDYLMFLWLVYSQKRATDAEYQASEAYKQIEKLKSKQETGFRTLNQQQGIAESHNHIESLHGDDMAKYDGPVEEPSASSGDEQWREEFEPFYKKDAELAKLAEPSWFSGYDRCNI